MDETDQRRQHLIIRHAGKAQPERMLQHDRRREQAEAKAEQPRISKKFSHCDSPFLFRRARAAQFVGEVAEFLRFDPTRFPGLVPGAVVESVLAGLDLVIAEGPLVLDGPPGTFLFAGEAVALAGARGPLPADVELEGGAEFSQRDAHVAGDAVGDGLRCAHGDRVAGAAVRTGPDPGGPFAARLAGVDAISFDLPFRASVVFCRKGRLGPRTEKAGKGRDGADAEGEQNTEITVFHHKQYPLCMM